MIKRALLILLILFSSLLIAFLLVREMMLESVRLTASTVMQLEQDNLKRQIREWEKDLKILARLRPARVMLNKASLGATMRDERLLVEEQFRNFLKMRATYIESIWLIDEKGRERVVVDQSGPTRRYINVAKKDFFRKAINVRPGQTIGSIDKVAGNNPTLFYTIKIVTTSGETGLIGITINVDSLISNMNLSGGELAFSHVYLFDNNNRLIQNKSLSVGSLHQSTKEVKSVYQRAKNTGSKELVFEENGAFWGFFESTHLNLTMLFELEGRLINNRVLWNFLPLAALLLVTPAIVLMVKRRRKRVIRTGQVVLREGSGKLQKKGAELQDEQPVRIRDLGHISNQLRIPLNNLLSNLSLMRISDLTKKQQENVELATRNSEWMLEILNEITDYAALKKGRLRLEEVEFSLTGVINEATGILVSEAYKKGIEVFKVINFDVPDKLVGDPTRLRQILVNLVANAIKSSEQGDISLQVSAPKKKRDKTIVRVEVNESGVGAETEFAFTVFAEFDRKEPLPDLGDGSNMLGVSISRQLIEMMGGKMGVADNGTGGSIFWLELPFKAVTENRVEKSATDLKGRRALIFGEKEFNRKAVAALLGGWGVSCDSSSHFDKIVPALERSLEQGHPYDILLIDLSDKESISICLDLVENIRKMEPVSDTPVVIMTSHENTTDAQLAKSVGVNEYLSKPVNRTELKAAVVQSIFGFLEVPAREEIAEPEHTVLVTSHDEAMAPVSKQVLVVENNQAYQKVLTGFVTRLGLEAVLATSSREAIKAIDSKSYGMVILDYHLPENMAMEVVKKIRKLENKLVRKDRDGIERAVRTPVIVTADQITDQEMERCILKGVDEFLRKPINTEDVASLMQRWDVMASDPDDDKRQTG